MRSYARHSACILKLAISSREANMARRNSLDSRQGCCRHPQHMRASWCRRKPRARRRSREAKAAVDAAEEATWASLLEEEMKAGPERAPEVEYEGWGYYLIVKEDISDHDL